MGAVVVGAVHVPVPFTVVIGKGNPLRQVDTLGPALG